MLRLISSFQNKPILSLQTGGRVGSTLEPIVDPDTLKVLGFHVDSPRDTGTILLIDDVREFSPTGLIIDRFDKLAHHDDLVRLQKVLKIDYQLVGKQVVTEAGKKVGKVSDYIIDDQSFFVARLYTRQSVVKNFSGEGLVVDRSQIVEIDDRRVVIKDPSGTIKQSAVAAIAGS